MKILIVGAGAVGSIVASRLSRERHDVTLIEADDRKIAAAQQRRRVRHHGLYQFVSQGGRHERGIRHLSYQDGCQR